MSVPIIKNKQKPHQAYILSRHSC